MTPGTLQEFIRTTIKSAWALELLILMRSGGARTWTVDQLTTELRGSPALVADILITFNRANLVKEDGPGLYRYAPASPELEMLAQELHQLYAERPLSVIKEIVSAPNEKLRTFVDAFRLKKD